ncbi:MAG TPA: acyl-CoA dehydrogenase [Amycolatopsis sp.]|nr:acyl-CoA dehydrogenase [Amycolatopsis sp.]
MDLVPSDEQSGMVDSVEQFLSKELSVRQLRDRLQADLPVPASAWAKAGEIGLFSLGLAADAGGADAPFVEEVLVFQPMGRHLAPVGFLGSAVATRLADVAGMTETRDAIGAGTVGVAVGLATRGATVGARVDGTFDVFDLPSAEWVLLLSPETGALALLPAGELTDRRPVSCLDPSTHMTEVAVGGLAPRALVDGWEQPAYQLGALLTTAMLVGIAEAVHDAGVQYAKERVQFGRPIGVNQAIKHMCADMAVRCEATRSLLAFAALAVRDGRGDAAFQVAAAKRLATDAAIENSRANVQIHGGMGYTWEHDAHLYLSRAHLLDRLFGDVHAQQAAILRTAPAVP